MSPERLTPEPLPIKNEFLSLLETMNPLDEDLPNSKDPLVIDEDIFE